MHRGDAIGRHTLRLRDATRERGFASEIFVDVQEPDTASETVPAVSYADRAAKGDVIVYQFATASFMAAWLAARRETLVVNYHNITPPELLAPWDNHLALGQVRAQADLRLLAPRAALAISDSAYNQVHLEAAGFAATAVIPPSAALETGAIDGAVHAGAREPGGSRWLAVGRVAPNKSLQDTIAALAVARARHDPDTTLTIIGKPATTLYDRALHRYVAELGLSEAVTFGGHASDAAVAAAYAIADVLVVTSEHEGFCVPVVEAMAVGLPVVAFAQGALPEVLGDAGTFVSSKDPFALSETIALLLADGPRCQARAAAAQTQLAVLDLDAAAQRFVELLVNLAQGEAGAR
jgi:L-malate glycosyltransferase